MILQIFAANFLIFALFKEQIVWSLTPTSLYLNEK